MSDKKTIMIVFKGYANTAPHEDQKAILKAIGIGTEDLPRDRIIKVDQSLYGALSGNISRFNDSAKKGRSLASIPLHPRQNRDGSPLRAAPEIHLRQVKGIGLLSIGQKNYAPIVLNR